MHIVQLLLPLATNDGRPLDKALFAAVRRELTDRFGGVTAYSRAPAEGLWQPDPHTLSRDDIVVFEVMVDALDAPWWQRYRLDLERRFEQDEIVIRSWAADRL